MLKSMTSWGMHREARQGGRAGRRGEDREEGAAFPGSWHSTGRTQARGWQQ